MDNRPNSRIHFVVHEALRPPGLMRNGRKLVAVSCPTHVYMKVMGCQLRIISTGCWPQSPTTTTAECPHIVLSFNPQQ